MTVKATIKLPNPEGVAAGSTATFRIPVGQRIHKLWLRFNYNASTQNLADFTEIRLYINSQVFQRYTATQRNALNQFDGYTTTNGELLIPFDRHGLKQMSAEEETALNTGVKAEDGRSITSMYMEVDLDAGMTIAASDLTLYALVSDSIKTLASGKPAGPGTIPYIRLETRTVAGADSDFQISDLVNPGVNAPDKVALSRITFIPSANNITNLRIDRNQYELFNRPDALNRAIQNNGVRVPQSGYYTIDTGENGNGGDLVDLLGITDYRYRLSVDGAMTITTLSEYMGVVPV
jgi:hypothetical protein